MMAVLETASEANMQPCELIASCIKPSRRAQEINGRQLILLDGEILIDNASSTTSWNRSANPTAGSFLLRSSGAESHLLAALNDDTPLRYAVYVDRETYKLRYGTPKDAALHLSGSFACTRENYLTFKTWQGFCAVEAKDGTWAVYFDVDDNGLMGKVERGTRVLEIEVQRRIHARISNTSTVNSANSAQLLHSRSFEDSPTLPPKAFTVHAAGYVPPTKVQSTEKTSPISAPALPERVPIAERIRAPPVPLTARTIVHVHPPVIESVTRLHHQRKRKSRSIGAEYHRQSPTHSQNQSRRNSSRHETQRPKALPPEKSKPEMTQEWVNSINFSRDLSLSFPATREDAYPSKHRRSGSRVAAALCSFSVPHAWGLASRRGSVDEQRGRLLRKESEPVKSPPPDTSTPTTPHGSWFRRRLSLRPKTAPVQNGTAPTSPADPPKPLKVEQDLAAGDPTAGQSVQDKLDGTWTSRPGRIRRSFSVRRRSIWV